MTHVERKYRHSSVNDGSHQIEVDLMVVAYVLVPAILRVSPRGNMFSHMLIQAKRPSTEQPRIRKNAKFLRVPCDFSGNYCIRN
jgi:hypothetical protein